jgi:uncharacterized LabA/DUF88 family protein
MLAKDRKTFVPPKNTNDMSRNLAALLEKKKVCVYIDAANLYHSTSIAKIKMDFFQLAKWFNGKAKIKKLNFYTAYDIDDAEQIAFLNELEKHGYNVVKKPLRVFETSKKGNMDIEVAVDVMSQQNLYDTMILLSGDGDFSYLLKAVETLGKETIVIGVGGFTSFELHNEADEYFFLNRIREVWATPKGSESASSADIEYAQPKDRSLLPAKEGAVDMANTRNFRPQVPKAVGETTEEKPKSHSSNQVPAVSKPRTSTRTTKTESSPRISGVQPRRQARVTQQSTDTPQPILNFKPVNKPQTATLENKPQRLNARPARQPREPRETRIQKIQTNTIGNPNPRTRLESLRSRPVQSTQRTSSRSSNQLRTTRPNFETSNPAPVIHLD